MSRAYRRTVLSTGVAGVLLVWLEVLLVRYAVLIGVLLVVVSALAGVLLAVGGAATRRVRWVVVTAGVGVLAHVVWWAAGWYPALVVAQIALLVVASTCVVQGVRRDRGRIGRVVVTAGGVVAALVSAALVTLTITPLPVLLPLQSALGYGNSFDPKAPSQRTVVDDGTLRINDVQYGSTYPNSYLDVYIGGHHDADDPTAARPTYVYVHGGGFFLGSKEEGDPAARGTDGIATIADPMLAAGYNVVLLDYALVPGVEYPTPTRQVSQAIAFLQTHGAEYGLDTSQLVLAGASGGALIVGQLSAVETNPAYAQELGLDPVMHGNLRAVVLDSAPLDPWRAGETETPSLAADFLISLSARAYLGNSAANRGQLNLIEQVDGNYPATFLSDGNTATYPYQSQEMHDRLDDLGVVNSLDLYPVSEAVLGHGFMAVPSPSTDDYNRRKIAFLGQVLGG